MKEIVLMCAILSGPFEGMTPCTPHKDMASCRAAEATLAISVVHESRCDFYEGGELGFFHPMPVPNPRRE